MREEPFAQTDAEAFIDADLLSLHQRQASAFQGLALGSAPHGMNDEVISASYIEAAMAAFAMESSIWSEYEFAVARQV
jgi:hypothetical protein